MVGREGEGVQEGHARPEGGDARFAQPWRVAAGFRMADAVSAAQAQHAQRGAALRQIRTSL